MKQIILILFLILCVSSGYGQCLDDIALLKEKYSKGTDKSPNKKELKKFSSGNEIEFITVQAFHFYKRFISSQDISSCNFTPSCSEYALQAIHAQGTIVGMLNFFDRFTRCNGINSENYDFRREKHLLDDPVRNIKGEIICHD